jgi:hypothetical protein
LLMFKRGQNLEILITKWILITMKDGSKRSWFQTFRQIRY